MSFRFKQFTIEHDQCALKVGTDAVLLGAWVHVGQAQTILDVGTGSGVIALMLAQRTANEVLIDGIEINNTDAEQARINSANSIWADRICIYTGSFQQFNPLKKYDLIVSNPPYFINSELPIKTNRIKARHTESLTHQGLLTHSMRLLKNNGRIAVVLPYEEGNEFITQSKEYGLHCISRLSVYSRKEKKQERWLFEFARAETKMVSEELILHGEGESWSPAYIELTRPFYIKL